MEGIQKALEGVCGSYGNILFLYLMYKINDENRY